MVRICIMIYGDGLDMRADKKGFEPPSFAYFGNQEHKIDEEKVIEAIEKIEEAIK